MKQISMLTSGGVEELKNGELDEKDYRLIDILRKDGRAPYNRIAKELGLSEAAVRKRIRKLVEKGVILRFTIDYKIPGESIAIVFVKTSPPTPTSVIAARILGLDLVDRVYEVTGDYDIAAIVKASSIDDINRVIDYVRSLDGVTGTHTIVVLRIHADTERY
ncbi:MAG: Lrp/AsnC family transcriptional regulator [Desulfurococcales archaeon]|nr:Lrp/AsnC family transcriptional regulator [Desulfurococcales archaeon]